MLESEPEKWDLPGDEEIYGVPNWDGRHKSNDSDGSDSGGGDYTKIGQGQDAWDGWDGCSPIAAAMILAYHEDQETPYWHDWGPYSGRGKHRDWYMDRLHLEMDTNSGGFTDPWNIDDGIENFSSPSGIEFSANNQLYHPRGNVKDGIQNGNPLVLSMWRGPYNKDEGLTNGWIDGHSVAVVGYDQQPCGWTCFTGQDFYMKVYDTYGRVHKIKNHDWFDHLLTRISVD
jgi:hypothetical protein